MPLSRELTQSNANLIPRGGNPFYTAMGNTNLYKNPKKPISDWPIKSCSSHANFFANPLPRPLDKNNRDSGGGTGLMHSAENTAIFGIVLAPHMPGVLHMTFSLHFLKNLFTLYHFYRYC